MVKEFYVEHKIEEILGTFVLLNSQDASFKESLVHKSKWAVNYSRQSWYFKEKSETQVKSRESVISLRGGNEYTQQKRIGKRNNMEVINID